MICMRENAKNTMERGEQLTYLVIYAALFLWVLELAGREVLLWLR